MRFLLGVMLGCVLCLVSVGCGDGRPDPRDNPQFDEEAYNDVDALPGMNEDGTLSPPPG